MNKVTEVQFYTAVDVITMLGVGESTAYKIINRLRKELVEKGYAEYPAGKIPKRYFHERYYGSDLVEPANGAPADLNK